MCNVTPFSDSWLGIEGQVYIPHGRSSRDALVHITIWDVADGSELVDLVVSLDVPRALGMCVGKITGVAFDAGVAF
jgi:hypothetical protein